jgi:UDP-N-acetyl-D-glucosamine/UDP-N-acetyl-D-galactosamine dehydrogenase
LEKINKQPKIAIIGLGYVGLPLAVAFAEKYAVVGYDINEKRVSELKAGKDHTLEIEDNHLRSVLVDQLSELGLLVSTNLNDIQDCSVYIVTVPTPTDKHNRPVLTPMIKASEAIASVLKPNDVVIYESTVYPGVTEEEMVPVLERVSGMKYNQDFFCGYSPERINPGDKEHTVTKILKVTSGSTPEAADYIDNLYKSIIVAGTHKASSIKVAEAAKVIENSQRDINIAFVNELAKIFSKLGIDTHEVLEAAGTKWNFLKFKPGLVGGHCIGVDPYYLAQKAQEVGYHPEIILAGRRVNDGMGAYVAEEVVKLMVRKGIPIKDAKCLILGFTFKENCPDVRNTRVIDLVKELKNYNINPYIFDPNVDCIEVRNEYNIEVFKELPKVKFESVILAVAHSQFEELDLNLIIKKNSVLYDVKGVLSTDICDGRL